MIEYYINSIGVWKVESNSVFLWNSRTREWYNLHSYDEHTTLKAIDIIRDDSRLMNEIDLIVYELDTD